MLDVFRWYYFLNLHNHLPVNSGHDKYVFIRWTDLNNTILELEDLGERKTFLPKKSF